MSWTERAQDDADLIEGLLGFELDSWQRNLVETAFEAYRRGDQLQLQLPGRRRGFAILQAARDGDSEALFAASLIGAQLDPFASVQRIVAQHADELAAIGVHP